MPKIPEIPNEVLAGTLRALQQGFPDRGLVLLILTPIDGTGRNALKFVSNLPVEDVKTACRGFLEMAQAQTAGARQ